MVDVTADISFDISDITDGTLDGKGDLDVLLDTVKVHLIEEYKADRITGDTYAQAYITLFQAAMANAIQFRLQMEQIRNQWQLTEEQKKLIIAQTKQVEAETVNIPKQGLILDQNLVNLKSQDEVTQAELLNIPKQGELLDQQVLNMVQQVKVSEKQVEQLTAEIKNIPKQGLLLDAQYDLTMSQNSMVDAEILNVPKQGLLIDAQKANTDAQTDLTEQKYLSEYANTSDTLPDGTKVGGTIGKQMEVYDAQILGFSRNDYNKAAKLMLDTWSIRRSTNVDTSANAYNEIHDGNIGVAVNRYFSEMGMVSVDPPPEESTPTSE